MKLNPNLIISRYYAQRKKNIEERAFRITCWKNLRELNYSFFNEKLTECNAFSFKHSGHLGDIIYALPVIKQLTQRYCKQPSKLYLNLFFEPRYVPSIENHPSGKFSLIPQTYSAIKPLLEIQDYISSVSKFNNECIDFDLDKFRSTIYTLDRGNISKWYQEIIPIDLQLESPWLQIDQVDTEYSEYIIIARSTRYHWNDLSYSFLKKYPKIAFVGLEYEYRLLKENIPNLLYLPTNNFLELARIIAGAKLFIGNQSSPFAIAEALKVNRLLECYMYAPNVDPVGGHNAIFSSQACFEFLVKDFYDN